MSMDVEFPKASYLFRQAALALSNPIQMVENSYREDFCFALMRGYSLLPAPE